MDGKNFEIFNNSNLGSIRVCYNTEDGETWFIAKDVCECLGISNTSKAAANLLPDEKTTITSSYSGSNYKHSQLLVNESGLYMLVMRSRKREAVEFQRWVTREVLPSIRKHGAYVIGQESMPKNERETMLKEIERIARKMHVFESDSNYWFEMYTKLLEEYANASESLVRTGGYTRKENGGIEPVSPENKSGFITKFSREGVWTDKELFIEDVKAGERYRIVEREMR